MQNDLGEYQHANEDLAHEGNAINGTIVEAKGMVNQREVEISKLVSDIKRAQDEGIHMNRDIELAQRNLREAH